MMDEFGFRSTSNNAPSVSYSPFSSSQSSRKTAASRTNDSPAQSSRMPSHRTPAAASSSSSLSLRSIGKSATPSSSGSNASIPKFRSLRNMLPFGAKQTNNRVTSISSPSRTPSGPAVSFSPAKQADLKHRRSSSSIPTPAANTPVPRQQGFMSVGRRTSLNVVKEKTLPALPPVGRSHSEDLGPQQPPIISIAPPSAHKKKSNPAEHGLPLPEDPFKKAPLNVMSNALPQRRSRDDFGTVRSGGELSTIIESELSSASIMKNSPPFNALKEEDYKDKREDKRKEDDDDSDSPILLRLAQDDEGNNNLSIMHAQDLDMTTATADLSASWEAGMEEFRRTLSLRVPDDRHSGDERSSPSSYSISPLSGPASAQAQTPPSTVPMTTIYSKSEAQLSPTEEGEQVSFNLTIIDPELAALLSPNNQPVRLEDDASAAIVAAVDFVEPPPPMHSSASPSPEPEELKRPTSIGTNELWPEPTSSRRTSIESRRRTVGLQSSPVRRSRPPSLALSSDSLPLADRSRRTSLERTPVNSTANTRRPLLSPTPRPDFSSPRASVEDLSDTVRRPALARSRSALARPATATDTINFHPRLYATPSRPSTARVNGMSRVSSDSGRPFLRSSHAREDSLYTPRSHSRSATSLGLSARTRRTYATDYVDRPATALSAIDRGPPPLPQRNRKRSLSAATDSRAQTHVVAPDWMGPRTARAFAAAGLLDSEANHRPPPVPPRAESRVRLAPSRASSDYDYRLNGGPQSGSVGSSAAPSRAGYSDHTYSPVKSRRTMSRTMTLSELTSARGESPVTSAASSSITKTVFSASTATSVSCSSPHQQFQNAQFESAIVSLKEKHLAEMEAVLSALGDSQRTSKSLREENTQLHGRIQDLEEQLADVLEQLEEARRAAIQPPMPNSFARTMLHHQRSSPSPSRLRTFANPTAMSAPEDSDASEAQTTMRENRKLLSPAFGASTLQALEHRTRNRGSTTSSVFPPLPSNMSMLLHDEGSDTTPSGGLAMSQAHGYASSAGSRSASPTLNVNRIAPVPVPIGKNRHMTKLSLSSIEMSMMSSLPSSPESLRLRPEHEKYLCDLDSLDFSVVDSD